MHAYLPYVFGSGSPIPNLFEQIVPHLSGQDFECTVYTNQQSVQYGPNVNSVFLDDDRRLLRKIKRTVTPLRSFDLVHTGGRETKHVRDVRLTSLRNPEITHVHTFRVDVDPSSSFSTRDRRYLAEHADVTTAVSRHTAETVREHFGIEPLTIYNGVDVDRFSPNYERSEAIPALSREEPVFLYVGSMAPRKRPRDVLDVADAVPDAQFVLVGDGPRLDQLSARAESMENVTFTGRLQKDELPPIYANSTAFLFPTIREGCPNVVLEAMASGLPVIGYEATSMPELVTDGHTGHLVEPANVEDLTHAVQTVLDSGETDEMGRNARQYVCEHHTFEKIAADYGRLYSKLE